MATDEGNSWNEMWHWINDEIIAVLCLIVGGGSQIAHFWEKNPQVNLIIIREWPNPPPPPPSPPKINR